MLENQSKKCSKCGEIKELSEFALKNDSKDGHDTTCKPCKIIYAKKYRIKNKNKIKNFKAEKWQKEKDIICEKRRIYRLENSEEVRAKARKYNSLDEVKKRRRASDLRNIERIKAYNKEYRHKNKKYFKEHRESEKGRMIQCNSSHKRRVKMKMSMDGTIPIDITFPLSDELQKLLISQDYKCNVCGCDISESKHLDHHIPISKGGHHVLKNVVWLCPSCNLQKGAKMPTTLLLV